MISVEEALDRCLALVGPLSVESIPLRQAMGRWMATPARAKVNQPPFNASAMDGYVIIGDPAPGERFSVIGEAGAGHAFSGVLRPGQAVRIFTGAPVPAAATRVVIQEDVERQGSEIAVKPEVEAALHIRPMGQDFRAGDVLSPRCLRPNDLGLLAAMNIPNVTVTRRPVVAIIATGDELVMPGENPRPDQIIASNSFAIAALLEEAGATVRLLPIARDTIADLRMVLTLAASADMVITIGGASVGDHDVVAQAAESLGFQKSFWRIAMRPGKPLIGGRLSGVPMLGLPGNPVSAVVCAHLFVLPMVRAMQGDPNPAPRYRRAILAAANGPNGPRAHYMRAKLIEAEGLPSITPFDRQDSALMGVLAQADALLVRPANDSAQKAGALVEYLPL